MCVCVCVCVCVCGKNDVKYIVLASVSHSAVEASAFQLRCKG